MIRRALSALASRLPEQTFQALYDWRRDSALGRTITQPFAALLRSKQIQIPRGLGAGLRLQGAGDNASYALGVAEPVVQRVLQEHLAPGDTFYDVGANVGFFSLLGARLVGPEGIVVSFEPAKQTADVLRKNVRLNNFEHICVIQRAVSDEVGTVDLLVGPLSQTAHLAGTAPVADAEVAEQVQVATIDALTEAGEIPAPTFIKMDIEGAELAALRGMRQTLSRHRPTLLCELHGTGPEVAALLLDLAYTLKMVEGGDLMDPRTYGHVLAVPAP